MLEAGMAGQQIELVGFVLSRDCKPIAGALIDFWQADDNGRYDNSGFRLRGHQFTDADGRYRLQRPSCPATMTAAPDTSMSRCRRAAGPC